jgi:hypothetical protein
VFGRFSSVLMVSPLATRWNSDARFAANSNIINDVSANHHKPNDFGRAKHCASDARRWAGNTFDCPARCVCALAFRLSMVAIRRALLSACASRLVEYACATSESVGSSAP